jgi:hypothetical protein
MKLDKDKVIRDINEMLQNLGDSDVIEMQIKLVKLYEYMFDLYNRGYNDASKEAWVKFKN